MTIYAVSVGDREYQVEVGESQLLVDGEPVAFELTSLNGNGLHLFRRGERSTEMYFKPGDVGDTAATEYEVVVNGRPMLTRVNGQGTASGRRTAAGRQGRRAAGAGDGSEISSGSQTRAGAGVSAPMPGLIVEVIVEAGQAVLKGDVLLTQESMKMQMQLRAPMDGRVTSVRVKAGDHVEKGTVLVTVEAAC
jgi:glutaconyl-CoA/methylmalonyl-CoA decarboxylase subunit gamma